MKTLLFIIALFGFSVLKSQEAGENFYFKTTLGKTSSREILKDGNNQDLSTTEDIFIRKRAKIKINRIEGDRVVFKYVNYVNNTTLQDLYNGGPAGEREFSMQKDVFNGLTNPFYRYFRGFSLGSYTVPVRLRSSNGNFEFDNNLSLGINLIGRLGLDRYSEDFFFDLSAGFSITRVNLNESNSSLGQGDFEDTTTQNPSAITFTIGILANLAKNVNVGGYIGWDSLATADNRASWIYNKKPWFGIGIGVSVGEPSNNSSQTAENDTE